MLRAVLSALTFASLLACSTTPPCATTCAGCCDAQDTCRQGTQASGCGVEGALCKTCGANQACTQGVCVNGGGGGTGGGTGGGAGGGAATGGGSGGGATGGGTGGGVVDGGAGTAALGEPCGTMADCAPARGQSPDCVSMVTSGGIERRCAFPCTANGASCAGGQGQCLSLLSGSGLCVECFFGCPTPDGAQGACAADERCVAAPTGFATPGLCSVDCRSSGVRCSGGGTCEAAGTCSTGYGARCLR